MNLKKALEAPKPTGQIDGRVGNPKILTIDIETSPNVAHVWSLWGVNVSLNQLRETGQVISFAAKWYGKKAVEFYSDHHDTHEVMVQQAHRLMDEADIIVHFNGKTFDMKHLRREFALAELDPPSPHKDIDLLQVVKSNFRFVSNKLDHVSQQLGIGKKTSHTGHDLWVRCMAGEDKAWALMKRYNIQDVRLTEQLYDRLRPWIKNHPHMGVLAADDHLTCNRCASDELEPNGTYRVNLLVYPQYKCQKCGGNVRGNRAIGRAGATYGV